MAKMKAKKALISVIVIGLVAMTAGAGTFAYFSDTETSTGNTFTAGTLDLKIRDSQGWGDSGAADAEWTLTDMKPGDSISGTIGLKNIGSIEADHLDIACSYVIDDPEGPESDTQENTPADYMADYMILVDMEYVHDGSITDCLSLLTDNDGDGIDLLELKQQGLDDLSPAPDGVGDERLTMWLKFSEDAGNDFQGDTLTVTLTFTLNQHSSQ